MSGIFGAWNLDGRPLEAAPFEQAFAQMRYRGSDRSEVWMRGPAGLGLRRSKNAGEPVEEGSQLVVGDLVCAFDGRLDNRSELIAALDEQTRCDPDCPDSHLVMAAYLRFGDDFAGHLAGDFALAVFDPRNGRLTVARDPVGVRPLCYVQAGSTFLFSSDAKSLLAFPGVARAPDEEMLAEFVLYFPSAESRTRTFFRGIRSLAPAHICTIVDGRLSVRPYFEFETARRTRLRDFHEYGEAFGDLFHRAVRRRLRTSNPVAVSVSGGLDSSYIFCLADRLAGTDAEVCKEVFGLNYQGDAGSPSDESVFLEELRRSCKAQIERIPFQGGFVATAMEDAWYSESPDIEGIGVTQHLLMNRAAERGARVLLTGHWGDQFLVSWEYLLDLLYRGNWNLFERHRHAWNIDLSLVAKTLVRDLLERIAPEPILAASRGLRSRFKGPWMAPWFTPRFRELLTSRFAAARLERKRGSSSAWYIYKQCHLSYQLHCMEWNSRIAARCGLEIAFPFLDRDLIQFLMSIPGEIQAHEGIPRNIMREAMRGIVPDSIVNRRTKGIFTHLGNESLEADFNRIKELLGPGSLAVELGFLDGPTLWKQLDEWREENRTSDTSVVAWRLTDLCGLEAFLRSFFGNAPRK